MIYDMTDPAKHMIQHENVDHDQVHMQNTWCTLRLSTLVCGCRPGLTLIRGIMIHRMG